MIYFVMIYFDSFGPIVERLYFDIKSFFQLKISFRSKKRNLIQQKQYLIHFEIKRIFLL